MPRAIYDLGSVELDAQEVIVFTWLIVWIVIVTYGLLRQGGKRSKSNQKYCQQYSVWCIPLFLFVSILGVIVVSFGGWERS